MRKFTRHLGVAATLIRNNVDTDAIIPSVEMKRVSRHGLSNGLFAAWRYSDRVSRRPNPEFVLNRDEFRGASILLSGVNFGCGSSREHAVWALVEQGFRAIIAVSFGAIFHANCIANGLLPVSLPEDVIGELADYVRSDPQACQLLIDLERKTVSASPDLEFPFQIADSDTEMLLKGLDPVALTLRSAAKIREFQQSDRELRPWVYL